MQQELIFVGMIPYPEIDVSHLLYGHVEYVFYSIIM